MKTISDFQNRMKLGVKVKAKLFRKVNNEHILEKDYGEREISIHQTNQFALKTIIGDKITNSWCSWPTQKQFHPISENEIEIHFESGKLVYTFLD
ncbi:hypothetical protein [Pseudoflavitalea rhizosphaerae]|uniref:hypothetical protein n=1 Tax=Pseudoflavitalea rhizosphaerae TaxID=1884793 RepID=UPI000F8CFB74|nr:hypothetical protein [Pseudoflavitalea rhizosphaerae]